VRDCSKCGQAFDAESCPLCGNPSQNSTRATVDIDKSLKKYAVLLMAGMFGICIADWYYTPLDENPWIGSAFAFWGVGCVLIFVTFDRSACFIGLKRRMLAFMGPALVLFAAFIILNGALDSYPPLQAETRVVRKWVGHGRWGTYYHLVVILLGGRDETKRRFRSPAPRSTTCKRVT